MLKVVASCEATRPMWGRFGLEDSLVLMIVVCGGETGRSLTSVKNSCKLRHQLQKFPRNSLIQTHKEELHFRKVSSSENTLAALFGPAIPYLWPINTLAVKEGERSNFKELRRKLQRARSNFGDLMSTCLGALKVMSRKGVKKLQIRGLTASFRAWKNIAPALLATDNIRF